jgi:4-hydroxy-2-oxoheptanedioate aldolase
MAATKADYITYEMEHGPLDFKELREFMRGLVESGPTRTGHKTPAVVVTLPLSGTTDALRANAWMIPADAGRRRARHSAVQCRKPRRPPA